MISSLYGVLILALSVCAASVYAPPGQSIDCTNFILLQVHHIMPPIDAHEIFSQYIVYFSTSSHFAQILKMALLSISLNLKAQYLSQLWTQSGATYSQEIIYLVYIVLKL